MIINYFIKYKIWSGAWAYPGMARGLLSPPLPSRRKVILKNFKSNQNSKNGYWKLTNEKNIDIFNFLSFYLVFLNFL